MQYILRYFSLLLISFFAFEVMAQVNVWRDIYEVKKKDTIFGIARKYDIISKKRGRKRPLIVFLAEDLPRCFRYFPAPVKS